MPDVVKTPAELAAGIMHHVLLSRTVKTLPSLQMGEKPFTDPDPRALLVRPIRFTGRSAPHMSRNEVHPGPLEVIDRSTAEPV
jgi:hypothetical protein